VLADAGYDEAGLEDAVLEAGRVTLAEGIAALPLRPDADEPLPMLARLFLGGEAVDSRQALAVLAPLSPDDLADVLIVSDGAMRARVKLEPFDGLLVASDPTYDGPDTVLGVGGVTRMLAALTVRRRCEAALDLCTGSGALALLAAAHAKRVVGVDLSERALRLAHLNSRLNGIETIDWRRGDLFEPVGGERFDLVTANPPFVVSPSRDFVFRDGGFEDDELSAAVVAGVAAHLQDGGYAHVVCNWTAATDGAWSTRPRDWVRDTGCDALVLRYQRESAVTYALRWNRTPGRTLAEAAIAAKSWLDYYREHAIESLVTGAVILRRRSGSNWVHEDELLRPPTGAAGDHVERLFAGQDALAALEDERDLLTLTLAPAPGTMVVERRYPSGEPERARLSVEKGVPLTGRIPTACVPVISALDGQRSLREAIDIAAHATSRSPEALTGDCLSALTDLVGRGLLVATADRSRSPGSGVRLTTA
jgi:methylase of polypeptide subunit release factors